MAKENNKSEKPDSKGKGIFTFLAWIAAPAIAGALSPWYLPLLAIDLFPDYFRPLPQVAGSSAFLIAIVVAGGFHRRTSQERMRKFLLRWIIALALCFVACFAATQIFSYHWQPDAIWEIIILPVWLSAFATIFVSMAVALVLAGYLIRGNDA